jgi:hypothetical protein
MAAISKYIGAISSSHGGPHLLPTSNAIIAKIGVPASASQSAASSAAVAPVLEQPPSVSRWVAIMAVDLCAPWGVFFVQLRKGSKTSCVPLLRGVLYEVRLHAQP